MARPKAFAKPANLLAVRAGEDDLRGCSLLVNPGEKAVVFREGRSLWGELPPGSYTLHTLRDRLAGRGPVEVVIANSGPQRPQLTLDNLRTSDNAELYATCELTVQVGNLITLATTLMKDQNQLTCDDLAAFLKDVVAPAVRRVLAKYTLQQLGEDIRLREKLDVEIKYELTHGVDQEALFALHFVGVQTFNWRGYIEDSAHSVRTEFALFTTESEAAEREVATLRQALDAIGESIAQLKAQPSGNMPQPVPASPGAQPQGPAPAKPLVGPACTRGWTVDVGAAVTARVAIWEGTVFAATHKGQVWALDLATGAVRWGPIDLGAKIEGGLAMWKRKVVVPCGDGTLALLDSATGNMVRRPKVDDELRGGPLVHRDMAFVGTTGGEVVAVVLDTGVVARRWTVGACIKSTPALWGELLLVTAYDFCLHALDSTHSTGQPQWTFRTKGQIHASPVVDESGGRVYFGSLDGAVYAVDHRGNLAWDEPYRATRLGQIYGTCALANGRLFVGDSEGQLHALDARTGHPVWPKPFATGGWIVAAPSVWEGLVFFGSNDGYLYCVDAATGKEFWRVRAGDRVQCEPVVTDDGLVVFGTVDTSGGSAQVVAWHGGDWGRAAARAERNCKYREAAMLYEWAGCHADARRMWHQAQDFGAAGDLMHRLGELTEAAEYYRTAASKAERAGDKERAAEYYEKAADVWAQIPDRDEAEQCYKRALRCRGAPVLAVEARNQPSLSVGQKAVLEFLLKNEGKSKAREVRVRLRGGQHECKAEVFEVAAGKDSPVEFKDFEISQAGEHVLQLDITYLGPDNREYRCQQSIPVSVREPEQPPLKIGEVVIVQGPMVRVRGDAGQVIQEGGNGLVDVNGDAGTVVQRPGDNPVRSPSSESAPSRMCPKCGKPTPCRQPVLYVVQLRSGVANQWC